MEEKKGLPSDFDGVFRFTNFTDSDFKARWNNIEYTFPAQKTTPLLIPGATPEEVQHIRKKFAKELGVREFGKGEKAKYLNSLNPVGQTSFAGAVTYVEDDLKEFIQRCLEPLPMAKATVTVIPPDDGSKLKKDRKGRNVTRVLEEGESLLGKGSENLE